MGHRRSEAVVRPPSPRILVAEIGRLYLFVPAEYVLAHKISTPFGSPSVGTSGSPSFSTMTVRPRSPGWPKPKAEKGDFMQNGSIMRSTRLRGPDVWEFRWREAGADGKRKHRRIVIGSTAQFSDKSSALLEVAVPRRKINLNDPRVCPQAVTVSELVSHYRQCELATDHTGKTHSTKVTYQGYLNKWILPRWKNYALSAINAGEVELWLRCLPLARASCAKIRSLMSVVFNHAIRHQVYSRNPIRLVRQSAKRRKIPVVLSASEVRQ